MRANLLVMVIAKVQIVSNNMLCIIKVKTWLIFDNLRTECQNSRNMACDTFLRTNCRTPRRRSTSMAATKIFIFLPCIISLELTGEFAYNLSTIMTFAEKTVAEKNAYV